MGYPKLDLFKEDYVSLLSPLPEKLRNGKPIVIYAPHWTYGKSNSNFDPPSLGSFDIYYDYFLKLLKENPQINFIFKPHPDLEESFRYKRRKGFFDLKDYQNYVQEWQDAPNGIVLTTGEYINIFKESALLITDSGSFVAEYLPSGSPCIYLLNPNLKEPLSLFNDYGKDILSSYYLCLSYEEFEKNFNMIMKEKKDPLKEMRSEKLKTSFFNFGKAGKKHCRLLRIHSKRLVNF